MIMIIGVNKAIMAGDGMMFAFFLNQKIMKWEKSEFHNDSGPIMVSKKKRFLKMLEEFINAAEEKGIQK